MDEISREQAKKQGLKYYFTGTPCKRGHIAYKRVVNCQCLECAREDRKSDKGRDRQRQFQRRYYKQQKSDPVFIEKRRQSVRNHRACNPEQYRKRNHDYYLNNKQYFHQCSLQWHKQNKWYARQYYHQNSERYKPYKQWYYIENKEHLLEISKRYREENSDYIKERDKEYRKNNTEKLTANSNKRRAFKLNATPSWLTEQDYERIAQLYEQARLLTQQTGIQYVVDHYYPLQGKHVSGLHCPGNLQIITYHENVAKSNKLPEEVYNQ